jgi:hypothetical protein
MKLQQLELRTIARRVLRRMRRAVPLDPTLIL